MFAVSVDVSRKRPMFEGCTHVQAWPADADADMDRGGHRCSQLGEDVAATAKRTHGHHIRKLETENLNTNQEPNRPPEWGSKACVLRCACECGGNHPEAERDQRAAMGRKATRAPPFLPQKPDVTQNGQLKSPPLPAQKNGRFIIQLFIVSKLFWPASIWGFLAAVLLWVAICQHDFSKCPQFHTPTCSKTGSGQGNAGRAACGTSSVYHVCAHFSARPADGARHPPPPTTHHHRNATTTNATTTNVAHIARASASYKHVFA